VDAFAAGNHSLFLTIRRIIIEVTVPIPLQELPDEGPLVFVP
jgi:hypothetical protein